MVDVKDFVNDDKTDEALRQINNDPVRYTRMFTRIYMRLCRSCKARVNRNFLVNKNTGLNDYCPDCQIMAKAEFDKNG